jgi:outer membrane usher protein
MFRKLPLFFVLLFLSTTCFALATQYQEMLLSINLNGNKTGVVGLFLKAPNKALYLEDSTVSKLQIRTESQKPIVVKGRKFYNLNQMAIKAKINERTQVIVMNVPMNDFYVDKVNAAKSGLALTTAKPLLGMYVNYDLYFQDSSAQNNKSGLFNTNIFSGYGIVNNTFSVTNTQGRTKAIRLTSTWTKENRAKLSVMRLGDASTPTSLWGQSVGFGGFQWASDFNLNPNLSTMPMPAIKGQAKLPSVLNVYVNNALALKTNVDSGPFQISSLPVVDGQGNITLVTLNSIGQQQVITIPYYANSDMLKPGLKQYSYDIGYLRFDYGIASADYSQIMALASQKRGINNYLTSEWRAEVLQHQQTLGGGFITLIPKVGSLNFALSGSHFKGDFGGLARIGLNRQGQRFSWGIQSEYTTQDFMQLGYDRESPPPELSTKTFIGVTLPDKSSLSLSYVNQLDRGAQRVSLVSITYARTFFKSLAFNISGLSNVGGENNKEVFVNLSYSFNNQDTASLYGREGVGQSALNLQYYHNNIKPTGWSYNVSANAGKPNYINAGANWTTNYGVYSGQLSRENNKTSYLVEANGSVTTAKMHVFISQPIAGSFGIVQIPHMSNVGVYLENNLVATTGSSGYAFVPDMAPFFPNKLSLDPADLPLTTVPSHYSKTVVPSDEGPAFVKFNIRKVYQAVIHLKQKNGRYVPAGSSVTLKGVKGEKVVGYEGEAFVVTNKRKVAGIVSWNNRKCHFELTIPHTKRPTAFLGSVLCET